jgi:hypothetical protein
MPKIHYDELLQYSNNPHVQHKPCSFNEDEMEVIDYFQDYMKRMLDDVIPEEHRRGLKRLPLDLTFAPECLQILHQIEARVTEKSA